jgi:beta-ketoacyl-acyl-carrier-protein synthase II
MTRMMERVVITGIGVASPLGCDVDSFWQGLLDGRPGVVALEDEQYAGLSSRLGALVAPFDGDPYFSPKEARRMSRSSQLALVAADQAIRRACLTNLDRSARRDIAVIIGSSIGGFSASDPSFKSYYKSARTSPFTIPTSMNLGPASNVSIKYGYQGPLLAVDAACASAAHSIGHAYNLIRTGSLDLAITGGADSPFAPAVVSSWCSLRALSQRNDSPGQACRPFSRDRDGLALGEGAGILVLESEGSARLRGAIPLAEIKGYGASGDSHHITQPGFDGPVLAMQRALKDAGLDPGQIQYINAHATGTEANDRNETAAIKAVFGEHAKDIPVVGNKAALGHSIGASAALELISCILSIRDQIVPPTINYKLEDPDCDLDYVTEGKRLHAIEHALSNSFAFGGSNGVLIVSGAPAASE